MSGFVFLPPGSTSADLTFGDSACLPMNARLRQKSFLYQRSEKSFPKAKHLSARFGNELNCLTRPEIDPQISEDAADKWSHIMFEECEKAAPGKCIQTAWHTLRGSAKHTFQERFFNRRCNNTRYTHGFLHRHQLTLRLELNRNILTSQLYE